MKAALIALSVFCYSVAGAQLVMDQHPVSNKNWFVFLQSVRNDPTFFREHSQSMIPDQWGTAQTSLKTQDAPVYGVSWQQASAYCEWRSVVATYLHTHSKISTYQGMQTANASAKTIVTYRLPSEQEWEKSASRFTNTATPGIGFRCVRSVEGLLKL